MWTKAVLGEGGVHCRKLCEIIDEPLIEGMVVGTEKDLLSLEEREKVSTSEAISNFMSNLNQLEKEKYALQSAFLKQWVGSGINALLMPVVPWVGYKPKTWVESKQWMGYTAMWNLLNYAAVTVPVARADRDLDAVGNGKNPEWEAHSPRNEADEFNHSQCGCFGEYLDDSC